MILSWLSLECRDLCVLRHHLQFPFNARHHNKLNYGTAVLLQELHRWKAQEVTPVPHLQRPCRRKSLLQTPHFTHSRCRWHQPSRAGRRSRCARCCSGPRADNPHTSGCSPGQTCPPGTLTAKKHTGLSEQPDKNASTSSYLSLGCKPHRFGTKGKMGIPECPSSFLTPSKRKFVCSAGIYSPKCCNSPAKSTLRYFLKVRVLPSEKAN